MRFFHFRTGAYCSGRTDHFRNALKCPGPSQGHFLLNCRRNFRLFTWFCRKLISRGGMKMHLARVRSVAFAVGDSAILMAEMESTPNFGSRKVIERVFFLSGTPRGGQPTQARAAFSPRDLPNTVHFRFASH